MAQQVNGIQRFDEEPLLSQQQTVSHQPDRFTFDFKSVTTQFATDNQPTMVITHKTVLLDPHAAKEFLSVLKENIKRYEKEYGLIKVPQAIKKAAEKAPHETIVSTDKPTYMG